MKKLIIILIVIITVYFGINLFLSIFSKGHTVNYKVNNFSVKEVYTKSKDNKNYYLEIKKDQTKFSIKINHNFNNEKKLIKSIKYFSNNNYECIYPIFKNETKLTDLLCKNNNIIYDYFNIRGNDQELDKFANELKIHYDEKKEILTKKGNMTVYKNVVDNHYIGVENYKGLYLINENISSNELFEKDKYTKNIHAFSDKYYIVADYNNEYEFNLFYIVNLSNDKKEKIVFNKPISMDSYIQGSVENKFYLIDKSNIKQYEIDVKKKTVKEIGNKNKGMKVYQDGKWTNGNIYDAVKENKYINNNIENKNYYKVDKYGDKTGYYYMYKKSGDTYYVYRANIQDENNIKYLFKLKDISKIVYEGDYVYYQDNNEIKYYSDKSGNKTLLSNNELTFNHNLLFGVYIK